MAPADPRLFSPSLSLYCEQDTLKVRYHLQKAAPINWVTEANNMLETMMASGLKLEE